MPRAYLTRRIRFTASHRYPFGPSELQIDHEHSYWCDLRIAGEMDAATGFIIDLRELDGILRDEVGARFDRRNINTDVPEFADGKLIPSGENIARFVHGKLRQRLPANIEIVEVTIAEDDTLSASYRGDE